jgi:hypothetical protein
MEISPRAHASTPTILPGGLKEVYRPFRSFLNKFFGVLAVRSLC